MAYTYQKTLLGFIVIVGAVAFFYGCYYAFSGLAMSGQLQRQELSDRYRCAPGEVLVRTITTEDQPSQAACIPGHYK